MDDGPSPSSSTATAVGASAPLIRDHHGDTRNAGRVLRAQDRLRARSWKIAVLGVLVGPFVALTQAGPDAAGVTDLHRALASMFVVASLVLVGEGMSILFYFRDRRRPRH